MAENETLDLWDRHSGRWVDVLLRYRAEWLDLVAFGQSKGWEWACWLPASCAA